MKVIKINSKQYRFLTEDVFISDLQKSRNSRNNIATLTYNKSHGSNTKNKGNKRSYDMLKTDKMDNNNSDTYEVPLKGGIMSYNITSINGTEVMHYFKNIFDNKDTEVQFGEDKFKLEMENQEFKNFMTQFTTKVNNVISYCVQGFKNQNPKINFTKTSIYPVPSSSNFNLEMAKRMIHYSFGGISETQVINQSLLLKDLKNLKKDNDFISKNQEFYDSNATDSGLIKGTFNQMVDKEINKLQNFPKIEQIIQNLNTICKKILTLKNNRKQYKNQEQYAQNMTKLYINYYNNIESVVANTKYFDPIENKESSQQFMSVAKAINYTKGPSVEGRSSEIWQLVKPYLRGQKDINGKPFTQVSINYWQKLPFQIKNLPDSVRMGMKNYYNPNNDDNLVKSELEKIKGTVFVIFDDNISGGATLSDICMQCKNLGIEFIIPITFGKMAKKETFNRIPLNSTDFNY